VRSLAVFGNTLYQSDQQFVQLNSDLAQFTNSFSNEPDVANAMRDLDNMLNTLRRFLDQNASLVVRDVNDLASLTTALAQPNSLEAMENSLHVSPNMGANLLNIYNAAQGSETALPVIPNFANPMQFICSSIQAGSRLGYQESAELCAQYLAPILDAIKFNYLPWGVNMISTASTLPKYVSYSEERLRPPPGYKDTTVPGIWSRDTLFSFGNHEPGWIVAPGMQGVQVQPFTENMLTPESLAELMGGPDIVPPVAPPHFGPEPLAGAPNAYDENNPPAPPWFPPGPQPPPGYQPGPPPPPAGSAEAGTGQ
jgi:phospholipid/cholesterol/gamma-HCH transport system substrate-binding protein